jgi:hypothetical protein
MPSLPIMKNVLFAGNFILLFIVWALMPIDILWNGRAKWYRYCLKNFDYIREGYWAEDFE